MPLRVGVDLAEQSWAAGFFDGEGSVSYYRSPLSSPRIVAQVAQVERAPLERFVRAVGHGVVRGPYQSKNANHRSAYKWAVEGDGVRQVFNLLGPFLCEIKFRAFADAIDRLLAWREDPVCTRGHRGQIHANAKGALSCHVCHVAAGKVAAAARWGN